MAEHVPGSSPSENPATPPPNGRPWRAGTGKEFMPKAKAPAVEKKTEAKRESVPAAGLTAQIEALKKRKIDLQAKPGFQRDASDRLALKGGIDEQVAALEVQMAAEQKPSHPVVTQIEALKKRKADILAKPGFQRDALDRLALKGGIDAQIAELEGQMSKASPPGGGSKDDSSTFVQNEPWDAYPEKPEQRVALDAEESSAGRKEKELPSVIIDQSQLVPEPKPGMPAEELVQALHLDPNPAGTPPDKKTIKAAETLARDFEANPSGFERFKKGLFNLGLNLTNLVNNSIASISGRVGRKFGQKSFLGRWLEQNRQIFEVRAENTKRIMEGDDKFWSGKTVAKGASNLSWSIPVARVALGVMNLPVALLYGVTNASGTALEGAKGARLTDLELRKRMADERLSKEELFSDAERKKDLDTMTNEAWAFHIEAQQMAGGKEPTRAQLWDKFAERLPKEILARLKDKPAGVASGWIERLVEKDMTNALTRVQKKLDAIDADESLDETKKRQAREKLMVGGVFSQKWGAFLKDADRMITKGHGVDMSGYAFRLAEKAGKAARWGLVLGFLADTLEHFKPHELLPETQEDLHKNPLDYQSWKAAPYPESNQPSGTQEILQSHTPAGWTPEVSSTPEGTMVMMPTGKGDEIVAGAVKLLKLNAAAAGWDGKGDVNVWAMLTAKEAAVRDGLLESMSDKGGTGFSTEAIGHVRHGILIGNDGVVHNVFQGADRNMMTAAEFKDSTNAMDVHPHAAAAHLEPSHSAPAHHEPAVESPKQEILKTVAEKHRGVAEAVIGKEFGSLSPDKQEELGRELAELRDSWKKLDAADETSPGYEDLQNAVKGNLEKLLHDHRTDLPEGWKDSLLGGKGAKAADAMGYLSSQHDAIVEAVGAKQHALAEAIMGKDALGKLTTVEQTELGRQLAQFRADAENLVMNDTPVNHAAFARDLDKLQLDFKGKMPEGWDSRLMSSKASSIMASATEAAPHPIVEGTVHTETHIGEGGTNVSTMETTANLIGVDQQTLSKTFLIDESRWPSAPPGRMESLFRTAFDMNLRRLYAEFSQFDPKNETMVTMMRRQIEMIAKSANVKPQELFKADILKKVGLS